MSPIDKANLLQTLLQKAAKDSLISFTAGFPAEDLLPIEEMRQCYKEALNERQILQYSPESKGYLGLREAISRQLNKKKIQVNSDEILVTTGSSQAIDLMTRVTSSRGDVVLVERPTYQEVLKMLDQQEIETVGVQSDWEGMIPSDLEEKLKTLHPKFVYINPTFGNPNGKVWSQQRREMLIELCSKYGAFILEDDPYGDLNFSSNPIPTVYELAQSRNRTNVIYVSTFSKTIAPATRIGYLLADSSIFHQLVHLQHLSVIHSAIIDQKAVSIFLQNYNLEDRNSRLIQEYQSRLDEMEDELKRQFGEELRWNKPKGGIYLWVELPVEIDVMRLLQKSIEQGVSFFPGQFFYVDQPDVNGIRLNFTFPPKDKIRTGVQKLARVYQELKQGQ